MSISEYTTSVESALNTLDSLGSSNAIADHLGSLGIKGRFFHMTECPVAKYINMVCPSPEYRFQLTGTQWGVLHNFPFAISVTTGPVGMNVRRFAWNFDTGQYPGLVGLE